MSDDYQLDLYWRLLDKSTSRRASYASRASIILAADAIFTGTFVFFIKDGAPTQISLVLSLAGLSLLVLSTLFSLMATMNIFSWRSSREITDYPANGFDRLFISPKDTFKKFLT